MQLGYCLTTPVSSEKECHLKIYLADSRQTSTTSINHNKNCGKKEELHIYTGILN